MRCRTCGYRLWNLVSRKCPECGTAFLPSEYRFAPSSVRFCCPHCGQDYYGTDENGHLVPKAFTCGSCGQPVSMDEMTLLPTEGVEEDRTTAEEVPWLRRDGTNIFKRWLSTVGWAMVKPQQLMRLAPVMEPENSCWTFAVLTQLIITGTFIFPVAILGLIMGGVSPPGMLWGGGACCASFVAIPIAFVILVVIWGAFVHGLLRLTGPTADVIGRTFQSLCYSSGANILTATPCLGPYFGWIWWLVSAVLAVKEGQTVSGLRAAFAVLLVPVLLIAGAAGLYIWAFVSSMSGTGPFAPYPGMQRDETAAIAESIVKFADVNDGQLPPHAIQLAADYFVLASDFVLFDTTTARDAVPVAEIYLSGFTGLSEDRRQEVATAAARALPEGTTAHRLGDFVFTYHDIDLSTADPNLWLVVWSPDPDQNPRISPYDMVSIGLADGSVIEVPASSFRQLLSEQNDLRAAAGLPKLSLPFSVTHAKPMVRAP